MPEKLPPNNRSNGGNFTYVDADKATAKEFSNISYTTSVNEKTYDFSVNIAGILWGLGVYFLINYTKDYLFYALFLMLSSFLIPYLFFTKKDKIQRRGGKLFALSLSSYVILADFLAKFVFYGFVACTIAFITEIEEGKSFIASSIMVSIHCFMFWITRHIYWRFGENERLKTVGNDNEESEI